MSKPAVPGKRVGSLWKCQLCLLLYYTDRIDPSVTIIPILIFDYCLWKRCSGCVQLSFSDFFICGLCLFFFNCFHYLAAVALLPWSLVSFFCIFDEPFSWYPVLFSFYYCLCFSICGCVSLGVICCHIAFLFFSMLQWDGIQRLIKHLTHTIVYPQRVLVLVAFDVDALCACKILQVCCISWFNIQIIEKL